MGFLKNNRGISLVGLLGIALISSLVIVTTMRVAVMATRSSQIEQNTLVEGVLKTLVKKILSNKDALKNQCQKNFKNKVATVNSTKEADVSELKWYDSDDDNDNDSKASTDPVILKTGWFKNQLKIVKMKLENYNVAYKSVIFSVYYKKKGVGNLNTVKGGKNCNADNQTDCYFYQCEMTDFVLNTTTNTVTSCEFEEKCSD